MSEFRTKSYSNLEHTQITSAQPLGKPKRATHVGTGDKVEFNKYLKKCIYFDIVPSLRNNGTQYSLSGLNSLPQVARLKLRVELQRFTVINHRATETTDTHTVRPTDTHTVRHTDTHTKFPGLKMMTLTSVCPSRRPLYQGCHWGGSASQCPGRS